MVLVVSPEELEPVVTLELELVVSPEELEPVVPLELELVLSPEELEPVVSLELELCTCSQFVPVYPDRQSQVYESAP
jgi:hypothetical protein